MLYRYKIKPLTALATPLMSDTLFGHFCWSLLYGADSDAQLNEFLDLYNKETPAPVLFSSGFPQGYLPRPFLPLPKQQTTRNLVKTYCGNSLKDQYAGFSLLKEFNTIRFIPEDFWFNQCHSFSMDRLYRFFFENTDRKMDSKERETIVSGITLNRFTGNVADEGGLFSKKETWYPSGTLFDLYVEINDPIYFKKVDDFLTSFLPEYGYGADKSTGKGGLTVQQDISFDANRLTVLEPNAHLTLSLTAFDGMHHVNAFYDLKTKSGKLGGAFAIAGPDGGVPNPFKYPILMWEPGAVVLTSSFLNTHKLLEDVHPDDRIRHCGIPICLPLKIKEDDFYVYQKTADL